MFKPVPVGDSTRYSYARINEVLPMPHLIDIQRKSYEWFMREGLCEIFHDISPIKDFTGNLELSFEGFTLGDPKYSVEECKDVYKRQELDRHIKSIDNALQRVKRKLEKYITNRNDNTDLSEVYSGLLAIDPSERFSHRKRD